tara:strand:- start:1422 stop:1808 length:387 start_codon:yes stop_codon:yes gene_type:complete
MSVGYVIPNVSKEQVLNVLETMDNAFVTDDSDHYTIRVSPQSNSNPGTMAPKNHFDDFEDEYGSTAEIMLMKTQDEFNAWFWAYSVSTTQPNIVLDAICEKLQAVWYAESDREYEEIVDEDSEQNTDS